MRAYGCDTGLCQAGSNFPELRDKCQQRVFPPAAATQLLPSLRLLLEMFPAEERPSAKAEAVHSCLPAHMPAWEHQLQTHAAIQNCCPRLAQTGKSTCTTLQRDAALLPERVTGDLGLYSAKSLRFKPGTKKLVSNPKMLRNIFYIYCTEE